MRKRGPRLEPCESPKELFYICCVKTITSINSTAATVSLDLPTSQEPSGIAVSEPPPSMPYVIATAFKDRALGTLHVYSPFQATPDYTGFGPVSMYETSQYRNDTISYCFRVTSSSPIYLKCRWCPWPSFQYHHPLVLILTVMMVTLIFFEGPISSMGFCGGLSKNGPYRFIYLNV